MSSAPTGTVSFLFTDVAGSTRLWQSDKAGMAASLAVHDRLMRAAIDARDGYVFSIAGDSFGAAFPTATAAVETAIRLQLELASEMWEGPPIRVRMGVHTGSSEEREGNYFGPEVNRSARIMSAANAGQILVSGITAGLIESDLGEDVTLVDRGVHSLKDVERPEHLFELRHRDLPEVTGDLHTLDPTRVHLPTQLSSFVGREREITEVTELAARSRLVTLSGSGGTGKTRLAVEVAAGMAEAHDEGVWMVELASVTDPDLVVAEIAELWRLRPGDGVTLDTILTAHLADRHILLVVDNCEHLLSAVAAIVATILTACPHVSVIATSRESLGVPGEAVYRVPSLTLPADSDGAARSDAVRLFYERAGRVRADAAQSIDLSTVIRICRRLDGIPLGIELAAARLRTLGVSELADRLDESFRILSGGKSAVPRQRTLDTAIDWSHDLLDDAERVLFRRLAAFNGSFDLAAAETICADQTIEEWQVLDLLDHLVDKSLVVATHDAAESARFRLQEPIRRYASERLTDAGEDTDVRRRHARHYADWVAHQSPRLRGPEQRQANHDIMREYDNVRAALTTFLDIGDLDRHLWTCFHLVWFWTQSSLLVEGRASVQAGLERRTDATHPAAAARASLAAALLAIWLTDPAGADAAEQGIEDAIEAGDTRLQGMIRAVRGVIDTALLGGTETDAWIGAGIELLEASDDPPIWEEAWDAMVVDFLRLFARAVPDDAYETVVSGLLERAERLGDRYMAANARVIPTAVITDANREWALANMGRAVEDLRELDFRHGLGHALFYHGLAIQDAGRDAIAELGEASTILAEVGDVPCSLWSGMRQLDQLLAQDRLDEAGDALRTAARRLESFERPVDTDLVALACRWARGVDDVERAARLFGYAEANGLGDRNDLDACREAISDRLPGATLDRLFAEGASAGLHRVIEWIAAPPA